MFFVLPIFAAKRFEHLPLKCEFLLLLFNILFYIFYALYVYEVVDSVFIEKNKKLKINTEKYKNIK